MCTYRRCMSSTTTAGKFRLSGRSWSWCSGWKGRSWKTMHNAFNQGSPSIHICSLQHSSDSVQRWLSADFKRLPSFFQSWSLLLTFGKYCASCIWHHVSHVHTQYIYIDHPCLPCIPCIRTNKREVPEALQLVAGWTRSLRLLPKMGTIPFFGDTTAVGRVTALLLFITTPKKCTEALVALPARVIRNNPERCFGWLTVYPICCLVGGCILISKWRS